MFKFQGSVAWETAHWSPGRPRHMWLVLGTDTYSRRFFEGNSVAILNGYRFSFGSVCCLVGAYFSIEPFSFPCDVTACACDCFAHPLSISSGSWGDHLLGVHPSWDATFDGNWGGCPGSWFFYSVVVVVSSGTLKGIVDSKNPLLKHELAFSMSIPWSIDEWLAFRFVVPYGIDE